MLEQAIIVRAIVSHSGASSGCLSLVVHKPIGSRKFIGSAIHPKSPIIASSNHHPSVKYDCRVMRQTCSDQRWNPVHPTAGSFWGVGLGLGCGVGWGPGFGHEVIGYVGAGCGVGFSVGFTLAGVGIGLPQHGLIRNHEHGGN
ncbi:hypothetical protein SORBI_3005G141801 [Sorghum bicolor]|uniref:Uncharacterized protein n=1 Tax=Sorghum bicolor TaxID=4558 RepID=A0A1Z5RIK0_SORBI|nr:hypothetical protein SORBI_3005G141801 [Sorghum bicolor]